MGKNRDRKIITSSDLHRRGGSKLLLKPPPPSPSHQPLPEPTDDLMVKPTEKSDGSIAMYVVMVTQKRQGEFPKAFDAVYSQLEPQDRIVVVASGYTMFDQVRDVSKHSKAIGILLGPASVNEARRAGADAVPENSMVVEIDDHDYLRPNALSRLRKPFEDKSIGIVYGNHQFISKEGVNQAKFIEKPPWSKGIMKKRCWIKGTRAYRKWIYTRYGGWLHGEEPAGDHANAIRWEDAGCQFYHLPGDPIIDVTVDPDGITSTRRKEQVDNSRKFAAGGYKKKERKGSIRLLFVMHNNPFIKPRGGEKSMGMIIKYLQEFGYDCHLIVPYRKGEPSIEDSDISIEDSDISIVKTGSHPDGWANIEDEVAGIIACFKPDLILTWASASKLVHDLSQRFNIPYILFVRSFRFFGQENKRWFLECLRDADGIITNCKYTSTMLKDDYNIESIWSYVPVKLSGEVLETSRKYLTIIGREKAIDFLSDIAPKLNRYNFLVVDYRAREERKEWNITYVPYQSDLTEVWSKTGILLFPAAEDMTGTSRTTMEAMLQGIPTITQDRCGLKELSPVTVGRNADKEDWERAIKRVKKSWNRYSKKMRRFAFERNDPDYEMDKVRRMITDIMPSKGDVLFSVEEGIGNIIETLPAVKATLSMGYKADVVVLPSGPDIFDLLEYQPYFGETFKAMPEDVSKYDHLLSCHWRSKFSEHRSIIKSKHFEDRAEREWYMEIPRELGYRGGTPPITLFYPRKWFNLDPSTVVMSAGAVSKSWELKRWDYYHQLAWYFNHVALVGRHTDTFPEGAKWPQKDVANFIGKLSLSETVSLMAQCRFFVGNDGGLAHISAAIGVPTFIIFGPTSTIKNQPHKSIVITKDPLLDCQPCQFTPSFLKCEHEKCLTDLTPEEVLGQIKKHFSF